MKALSVEQNLLSPATGSIAASLASLTARFGLAAFAMAVLSRVAPWRMRRAEWGHGAALAAVTSVSMALQIDALAYTSASTAGFLVALYSILVPLLAWLARLRPMTPVLAFSCMLIVAGTAVLAGLDPRGLRLGRGEWETLGAAFLFAVQILWVDRVPKDRAAPSKVTLALLLLVAAAGFAALCLTAGGPALLASLHASPRAFGLETALALLGTALPFALMNRFQSRVGPVAAGFIYCGEPVATALGAFWLPELLVRAPGLYPNERLTWNLAAGGGLILAANLWLLSEDEG
jgi:drug/metabolite transporter (DMT)-like permease